MSDPLTTEPTIFNGRDDHGVDEKRRVRSRPLAVGAGKRPVDRHSLAPAQGRSLSARPPPSEMAKLMANLEAMPQGNPRKIALKRFIGSKSIQVTLDKAGRSLPDDMTRAADIRTQAV